ncbi:MAG: DUF423 domain-containing protein [Pseudomonadota bacterium]
MIALNSTARLYLAIGAVNTALAVILGAFAAHALKAKLDENMLAIYHTANEYHFYHAIGLLIVGVIAISLPANFWLKLSGWSMLGGILIFCVSLYILSITNLRWLGMITPIGGLLFIIAWLSLFINFIKK